MKIYKFLLLLPFYLLPFTGNSQVLSDTIFTSDLIKTVILQKKGIDMSMPIVTLNTNEKLLLSFDELSETVTTNYRYKIQHCNQDWTPSELMTTQFYDGFEDGSLSELQFSFNTTQPYVHYELTFPERTDKFRASGNYIITIFPEDTPEQPILRKQFYVVEPVTSIKGQIKQSAESRTRKQELEVTVTPQTDKAFFISNPRTDLSVLVMQNGRKDNIRRLPLYDVRGNNYNFMWDETNIFNGGNEFRYFDMKNIRNRSRYVREIDFFGGEYHVYLLPEKNKSEYTYMSEEDINGKFYIHADYRDNPLIEGDYGWVHFSLPMNQLRIDGKFYILGQFTNWTMSKDSQLQWNIDEKSYQTKLYLKQGFYNYQIIFLPAGNIIGDETVIEGNHYLTENEYHVFVYYRQFGDTSDRLVGFSTVKSR